MIPLTPLLERVVGFALTYCVHSTLLVGAVWLFVRAVKPRSNPVREALWTVALFGGVVTALMQSALGIDSRLGTLVLSGPVVETAAATPKDRDARTIPMQPKRTDSPIRGQRPRDGIGAGTAPPRNPDGISVGMVLPRNPDGVRAGTAPPRNPDGIGPGTAQSQNLAEVDSAWVLLVRPWIVAGLAAGAVLGILWLALLIVRSRRALRERSPILDGPLFDRLAALRARFRVGDAIALTISPRIATPVAFGIRRFEICVPARALTLLDAGQQEAMLAHELAHLVRRDPLKLLLARTVECVAFFQPLNRLARRRLFDVVEQRCDAFAVERLGGGLALAGCLAEVASWLHERRTGSLAPAMAESSSALGRRIEQLLDTEAVVSSERRQRGLAPLVFALLPLVAAAAPQIAVGASRDARRSEVTTPRKPRIVPNPAPVETAATVVDIAEPDATLGEVIQLLDVEISALSAEIQGLRSTLEDRGLTRFDTALTTLEAKLERLEGRRTMLAAWWRSRMPVEADSSAPAASESEYGNNPRRKP